MSDKPDTLARYREDIRAQSRMPFPVVMGGFGLVLALLFPGGLTGGQGFLIGLAMGILVPGIVTLYLIAVKTLKFRVDKEVETALAKMRMSPAGKEDYERSGEVTLGKGVR